MHGISRNPERFLNLASVGLHLSDWSSPDVPGEAILVHTIPPLPEAENAGLRALIGGIKPRRVIYISSTGVYGKHIHVDERTAVDPADLKSQRRIAEENWIQQKEWRSLIVRPAAIYGPGRGVHVRIGKGESPRVSGSGIVSRIHVDDLAAVLEAAIPSDLEGSWPLADDYPCSSDEINGWCAGLMRLPLKEAAAELSPTPGRRVNGNAIRKLLGISLAYPTYQAGILASVSELPAHWAARS